MPAKKPPIEVQIRWLDRTNPQGLRYAVLRWRLDGNRDQKTLGYLTPQQAEEARLRKEAELRLGLASSTGTGGASGTGRTVHDLVEAYLQALDTEQRGSARYREHELLHCERIGRHLGDLVAADIRESDLRRLVAQVRAEPIRTGEPMKRGSILDLIGCLRRIYRVGIDRRLVGIEPPRLPRNILPEDARPPRQLTEEEVRRLLIGAERAYDAEFERLLCFLAWCPRRPVAVFAVKRTHCHRLGDRRYKRNDQLLFVERDKGGYGRGWCPLTGPALEAVVDQLKAIPDDGQTLLWPAPGGGHYDTSNLAPRFARAVELADLVDVKPYDLRKFGATQVYRATLNIKETQRFTGHKDAQTLIRRYLYDIPGLAETSAANIGWSRPDLRLVAGAEGDEE